MAALSTPMLLNISPAIIATVKKGRPWTKYRVGTQVIGERPVVMAGSRVKRSAFDVELHRRTAGRVGAAFEPASQRVHRAAGVAPADDCGCRDVQRLERIPQHQVQFGPPRRA